MTVPVLVEVIRVPVAPTLAKFATSISWETVQHQYRLDYAAGECVHCSLLRHESPAAEQVLKPDQLRKPMVMMSVWDIIAHVSNLSTLHSVVVTLLALVGFIHPHT